MMASDQSEISLTSTTEPPSSEATPVSSAESTADPDSMPGSGPLDLRVPSGSAQAPPGLGPFVATSDGPYGMTQALVTAWALQKSMCRDEIQELRAERALLVVERHHLEEERKRNKTEREEMRTLYAEFRKERESAGREMEAREEVRGSFFRSQDAWLGTVRGWEGEWRRAWGDMQCHMDSWREERRLLEKARSQGPPRTGRRSPKPLSKASSPPGSSRRAQGGHPRRHPHGEPESRPGPSTWDGQRSSSPQHSRQSSLERSRGLMRDNTPPPPPMPDCRTRSQPRLRLGPSERHQNRSPPPLAREALNGEMGRTLPGEPME